jgi:hypothetical protein
MRFSLIVLSILLTGSNSYYVKKHIPDHILKTIVDPKIKKPVPKTHNITTDMLVGNQYEPWRKKSEYEIPRVEDHLIHEEDIHHDDIYVDPNHLKDAKQMHNVDLKIREKRRKANLESALMDSDLDDAEKAGIDYTMENEAQLLELLSNHTIWDGHIKENKPKNPDTKFLYQMIITVHYRDKFMKFKNSAEGNAIHIESMLT